jgi:hypothetical protein
VDSYERGDGWILFAGIMLMMVGFLNLIFGIAAIDDSAFFTGDERFVIFTDLNTWGWFYLLLGIAQLIAAFSIWNRGVYGRLIGIATAAGNAMIVLFTVNAYPIAAFMIFLIDVMVIYGLAVYGGRDRAAA